MASETLRYHLSKPDDTDSMESTVLAYKNNLDIIDANLGGGGGGGGGHVIEDGTGTQMTSRSDLQFTGGSEVSDDSTNDRTIVRVAQGVETSSNAYNQLSQAEKNDSLKVYFVNDLDPHEADVPIDVSTFVNKKERNMNIQVVNGQLVYTYVSGTNIGACSFYPNAIPADSPKIKFKFTTGTSYSTTTANHKITIGVKAVYQDTNWVFPTDTDWLVQKTYDTQNATVEDYIDISSITIPCYLMICGHGWNVTFENFWETDIEFGGSTKIMYEDVAYGDNSEAGTVVEANPSEPATAVLNRVKIDGVVYELPSSGGGGQSLTRVTSNPSTPSNVQTIVTIQKEN